jgi:hypothetical protein
MVNRVDLDRREDAGTRAEPRVVVSSSARTASHETMLGPVEVRAEARTCVETVCL